MDNSTTRPLCPLVQMEGITKRFGRHCVLRDVSFELRAGEVHVLAGENGAGKSTLIKILGGVYSDYEGSLCINGREVRHSSPLDASTLGVAIIHQELSLIDSMSVADNIFLGRIRSTAGIVRDRTQQREAAFWLGRIGLEIDVRRMVGEFPVATRQRIEIAKAVSQCAKVIVMDEPTSALNEPEVERLFELISQLQEDGCGIVYITHKMEEIERIADRITVLRDGRYVGTAFASDLKAPQLIQWMVGRELSDHFVRCESPHRDVCLETRNLSVYVQGRTTSPVVQGASLAVRSGEIVGIAGLQGAGASELFCGLFGAPGYRTTGQTLINGKEVAIESPRQAINTGLALLTNDRKQTGLVIGLSVVANIVLASLRQLSVCGWRRVAAEHAAALTRANILQLRATSLDVPVGVLSGGNQQKVAIAKWLETKPRVLLLDEPTRGIDIGAKREIYEMLHRLTQQGIAILLITSELSELLALSDRIIVMHRGQLMTELRRAEATPANVIAAAMGTAASDVRKAAT